MGVLVNYKKLEIYHIAHDFVLQIYVLLKKFPEAEGKNLVSQIQRAATCLPLNIAEGSGCQSYKSYRTYLYFAYRSALEVEAGLVLGKDLGYLARADTRIIMETLDKFIRKLFRYIIYVENKCKDRDKKYMAKKVSSQEYDQRSVCMDMAIAAADKNRKAFL
jgi:four helix bundle protein